MLDSNDLILIRSALTSVEAARGYLNRTGFPAEDFSIVDAVNAATAWMETYTARQLRERLYVNTQAFSITATADALSFTGTGLGVLKVGMDAVGVNCRPESQIDSIAGNGLSLNLTQPAKAAGAFSCTFGSEPLLMEWPGGAEAALPEFPCEAVYSLKVVERDGTKTAIDLTNVMLRKASGIVRLMSEWPAKGQWVEIEAKCGYRPPTSTDRGHAQDWNNLSRICHRIVQVLFQDYRHQIGRSLEVQIRDQIVRFADLSMPKDITGALAPFVREEV